MAATLAAGTVVGLRPTTAPSHRVAVDASALRSGDLIFRRGTSLESRTVLSVDSDSEYSHVGIVLVTPHGPLVIHAAPGPTPRSPHPLRVEALELFIAPERAVAASVRRLHTDDAAIGERAAAIARRFARDSVLFDGAFRLDTADRVYCTELVWRAYREAGVDLVNGRFDTVSFPLLSGAVLLPSSLLRSPYLAEVHSPTRSQEKAP